jgi:hypothetical protein
MHVKRIGKANGKGRLIPCMMCPHTPIRG